MTVREDPFELRIGTGTLSDTGMSGSGARKLVGTVDADRTQLAGVTYSDPDGELAYCYNSGTATMHLHVYERARQVG